MKTALCCCRLRCNQVVADLVAPTITKSGWRSVMATVLAGGRGRWGVLVATFTRTSLKIFAARKALAARAICRGGPFSTSPASAKDWACGAALSPAPSSCRPAAGRTWGLRADAAIATEGFAGAARQPALLLWLGHARRGGARHVRERPRPVAHLQRVHPADRPRPRHLAHLGLVGLCAGDPGRRVRSALGRPSGRPLWCAADPSERGGAAGLCRHGVRRGDRPGEPGARLRRPAFPGPGLADALLRQPGRAVVQPQARLRAQPHGPRLLAHHGGAPAARAVADQPARLARRLVLARHPDL